MTPEEGINTNDRVRHGSEEARAKAIAKMKQAAKEAKDVPVAGKPKKDQLPKQAEENKELIRELRKEKSALLNNVRVYSPFHVYFNGKAKSISAINGTGPFDVLPGHKNFLTLLKACEIIIRTSVGEERLKIERGVMHVRRDEVIVFLDV